jgi:hypothetical protein
MQTARSEGAATKTLPAPTRPAAPMWAWSAVFAALLFAFCNTHEARVTKTTIRQTRTALEKQIEPQRVSARAMAPARREALILTDAKSLNIAMPAGNKDLPMLQATWSPKFGLDIAGQRLAPPPGNRILQLWLIPKATAGKSIPSLTLRLGPDGEFDCCLRIRQIRQAPSRLWQSAKRRMAGVRSLRPPIWVGAVGAK